MLDRLAAAVAVLAAPIDTAGRRQATVPIESIARAAGLLQGFADTIEVLAPAELRCTLGEPARRTVTLYRGALKRRRARARDR